MFIKRVILSISALILTKRLGKALRRSHEQLSIGLGAFVWLSIAAGAAEAIPLSPGDRLEVSIPNDTYFARVYEVNQDGNLEVPYLGSLSVAGLEPEQAETKIADALIQGQYFPGDALQLTVQVVQWSQVYVHVSGDVYQPGRVLVNRLFDPLETPDAVDTSSLLIPGRYRPERYLSSAVRAAAGVLPTADIKNVRWIRGDQEKTFDLTGLLTGEPLEDIPVIAGDQIIIPSTGIIDPLLMRPSPITPAGVKVFSSNLTQPAPGNSTSAINNQQEGVSIPYGTRWSQMVVASNCAGGTRSTNAHRYVALFRVNRETGEANVFDRPLEELMRNPLEHEGNPFLMPGDAIVCYDSTVTNVRDIFQTLTDVVNPFRLFGEFINLIF